MKEADQPPPVFYWLRRISSKLMVRFIRTQRLPPEIIAELNKAVNEILADPAIIAKMVQEGTDPIGGSSAQLGACVKAGTDKWRAVVRTSALAE